MKLVDEKLTDVKLSMEAATVLAEFKETPFWGALKELMKDYIRLQKDLAWRLNEKDDKFAVKHAQLTSKASAFNFLIKYIEEDAKRESQE